MPCALRVRCMCCAAWAAVLSSGCSSTGSPPGAAHGADPAVDAAVGSAYVPNVIRVDGVERDAGDRNAGAQDAGEQDGGPGCVDLDEPCAVDADCCPEPTSRGERYCVLDAGRCAYFHLDM